MTDTDYMQIALAEARAAAANGEVPIGAVVVFENEIVARAGKHNHLGLRPDRARRDRCDPGGSARA